MAKTRYNIIEITQKKTGITYIYEDYSYWNREKGYSTHKRKSIGKLDANGNCIYNRYYLEKLAAIEAGTYAEEPDGGCASSGILEEQLPPGDSPSVSYTILVGQKMVLDKCCNGIQLRDSLLDAFPSDDVDAILALAYYVVCQGKAFSRSEDWLAERGYSDLGLTSQRISELLGRISDDRRNAFFKSWMQRQPKGDSLLFDITSVSTYGTSNLYAERGYNRDGEDLEQVNLALLSSVSCGLPLWYCVTPGSMADVAVIEYVTKMLRKLEVKRFTFFGDRGFYSEYNLKYITNKGHKFTVPVPSSVAWQKKLIAEHRASMLSPRNVIETEEGGIVYGKTVYKTTEEYGRTWYHIYFDPTRKNKIVNDFMQRLRRCKDELEAGQLMEKNKHIYETYFTVRETPKRGRTVEYNDKAIQDYIENDSCYWVLMSTEEKDTRKALSGYRTRNDVEVSFDDVKNSLDMRRMRNHTEQTVRGKIFVVFIALILLSQLRLTVRNIPPKQRRYWTEHEFLDKVASYTKVHFEGKYKDVYTVPTANQRHVFDMLELPYRYKGVAYNQPPKKEAQKVDADHSTTHDNESTDEVPAT